MQAKNNEPVDFVVTWVDGSDPEWQKEKAKYSGKEYDPEKEACRFRDWEIFKYWFRAVEKYAPWVRTIHLVTCGQVPDFLDLSNPKIHLVKHEDYIPKENLPVFSSMAIEVFLNRIDGLSEQFVYFNDDFFLNGPVEKETFFRNGLPCMTYSFHRLLPPTEQSSHFAKSTYYMASLTEKRYEKTYLVKKHFFKVFNPRYGLKTNLHNAYMLTQKGVPGFWFSHVAVPYTRSFLDRLWEDEKEVLEQTGSHRFRCNEDVSQIFFYYQALASGQFSPCKPYGCCLELGSVPMDTVKEELLHGNYLMLCLNDDENCLDFETKKKEMIKILEKKFPEKSSFEK